MPLTFGTNPIPNFATLPIYCDRLFGRNKLRPSPDGPLQRTITIVPESAATA